MLKHTIHTFAKSHAFHTSVARHLCKIHSTKNVSASCSLESWLSDSGAFIGSVKLQHTEGNNGKVFRKLMASKDITANSIVISIPTHLQLRYDEMEDPLIRKLITNVPIGSDTGAAAWQFQQALTLLWHWARGERSPLYPYIQTLPGMAAGVDPPLVGMLMSDAAIQELQYSPVISDIENQRYWWRKFATEELSQLPSSPDDPFGGRLITAESFGWAVSLAMSRSFGRTSTHVMTPLIDMADHSLQSNCEIRRGDDDSVQMFTKSEVRAGEELTLTYGSHDSPALLLSYGFVVPHNPHEKFMVEFNTDSMKELIGVVEPALAGPLHGFQPPWHHAFLIRLGLGAVGAPAPRLALGGPPSQPLDPRLLAALRVMTLVDKAGEKLAREALEQEALGIWSQPLARQHELVVLKVLVALTSGLYQSMGTTIQQDKQLLSSSGPIEADMKLAVELRLQVKLGLERTLKCFIERAKELQAIAQ